MSRIIKSPIDGIMDRYDVIARYVVPSGKHYSIPFTIEIIDDNGEYIYRVKEKYEEKLLNDAKKILDDIIDIIQFDDELIEDPVTYMMNVYDKIFIEGTKDNLYFRSLRSVVEYIIIKDIVGYSFLTPLLADEYIEDITLSSPNSYIQVLHRKYSGYGWIKTDIYLDEDGVEKIISRLAFRSGKSISILQPLLEGVLPEKFRVSATYRNELSPLGSSFTIRKFKQSPLTLRDLTLSGFMEPYLAALIRYMVERKRFIMIVGPSGSGKTTLLNAILLDIPKTRRIVTLEEIPEINLMRNIGWKPLTTRWDRDPESEMLNLLRYALRERADYIAVGESRGLEVRLVFQAAATGHGCITTFHASSMKELYARLKSKPISIDSSMFKLLDLIIFLNIGESRGGYRRYVDRVYLGLRNGKWICIYKDGYSYQDFLAKLSKAMNHENLNKMLSMIDNYVVDGLKQDVGDGG